MAGSLLDIYGLYDQAYNRYSNLYNQELAQYQAAANRYNTLLGEYQNKADAYNTALDEYLGKVDEYNRLANVYNADLATQQAAYQAQIDAYNASLIQDQGQYVDGNFNTWANPNTPYTDYNGYTVGRQGSPIETYQAQQVEYGSMDEWGNPVSTQGYYDPRTGLGYNNGNFDYANENAYLNPNTGLVSIFTSRPGDFNPSAFTGVSPGEWTMEAPQFNEIAPVFTEPDAPLQPSGSPSYLSTGNVRPEELYQKTFGRSTPDVLSNEAWGLANIGTPFLSSEPTTAYETGSVAAINNPLSYVGPDALTTGSTGVDQNSLIAGQNPYYMT